VNVIMKFGGTSVADADAMDRVIAIVRTHLEKSGAGTPPVVVVSAMSKVTDRLIEAARLAGDGEGESAAKVLHDLLERHAGVAKSLVNGDRLSAVVAQLASEFSALMETVRTLARHREVSPSSHDAIVALGELASSQIVAAAFAERGIRAAWVDARAVLVTDDEHMAAMPDMEATCRRTTDLVGARRAAGEVVVLGGFIGATAAGVTTTLGRGGSDYSAAVFGACLDVDEIQIWTDVDGMLTADPRVVGVPHVVAHLSFGEASELAYFGAKVLHPSTILPAVTKDIPVRILNSRRPDAPGTLITGREAAHERPVTALACKRRVTVVDITSTRMLMAHGFLRRLFEIFERFRTAVDVVTTSEVSVSVTVDDDSRVEAIAEALREFAEVRIERDMAILCAVGDSLRTDPHIASRVLGAIDEFPFRMVSQAASRRNVTIVLRDADLPGAMARLHEHFFGRAGEARLAASAEQA
jgi:aspartate kinase